ncbi:MAG: hypothetical protein M3O35_20075 [Acidobacteriota bacterium]|nr:hypothetical protein [Acidobacteriota bacterium]
MRNHNATVGPRKLELSRVASSAPISPASVVVVTSMPRRRRPAATLVQVKPHRHPSGCFLMILKPLRIKLRRVIPARFVYQRALRPHVRLNLLDVIEIPGERGVYVAESD